MPPVGHDEIFAALSALFGYRSFRPFQEDIVRATLAGRDSFTVMPTGGGKSLCYQLPAHILPGTCVVISPLIALMKDQVDGARATGLSAAALNSSSPPAEQFAIRRALEQGQLDLLYVSPERMGMPDFIAYLQQQRLSFFAIDEAHCISEWGHDFRPDYLLLSNLVKYFPQLPIAAFTATATRQVATDIVERLGLRNPFSTRASFNRPNLFYQVFPKEDLHPQLLEFLAEFPAESGIIYRNTRKNVEDTAKFLQSSGIKARAYHAGLPQQERSAAQDAFNRDECRVIVATIAFGMGIDKSNVRFVAHGDLPKNLEGYYQETGRAGRDGVPSHCALFYDRKDGNHILRLTHTITDPVARDVALKQFYKMQDFATSGLCRRRYLLNYFGERLEEGKCGGCDICMGEVEREDATINAQKALSAMVRTKGIFGASHITNILTGCANKEISDHGHDKLPTFGVGADKDASYWLGLINALCAQGMAVASPPQPGGQSEAQSGGKIGGQTGGQTGGNFSGQSPESLAGQPREYPARRPGFAPTEKGWRVLRGQETFHILRQLGGKQRLGAGFWGAKPEKAAKVKKSRDNAGQALPAASSGAFGAAFEGASAGAGKKAASAPNVSGAAKFVPEAATPMMEALPFSAGLFEALREERARMAAQGKVPPFVIFSDKTLQEIAGRFPDTPELLLGIGGVGEHKLQAYGEPVLAVVRAYAKAHPEELPPDEIRLALAASARPEGKRAKGRKPAPEINPEEVKKQLGETAQETLRLFEQGQGLNQIAETRGLKPRTIIAHLESLSKQGHKFPPERFFTPKELELWQTAFARAAENGQSFFLRPAVEYYLAQQPKRTPQKAAGNGVEKDARASDMRANDMQPNDEQEELYAQASLARLVLRGMDKGAP